MGRPTTRQASKEGACTYPFDSETRDENENESVILDSEDKERREEVSGSEHGASDEEVTKGNERPKFQFTRTKGVQPSRRCTANREASTYCNKCQ